MAFQASQVIISNAFKHWKRKKKKLSILSRLDRIWAVSIAVYLHCWCNWETLERLKFCEKRTKLSSQILHSQVNIISAVVTGANFLLDSVPICITFWHLLSRRLCTNFDTGLYPNENNLLLESIVRISELQRYGSIAAGDNISSINTYIIESIHCFETEMLDLMYTFSWLFYVDNEETYKQT